MQMVPDDRFLWTADDFVSQSVVIVDPRPGEVLRAHNLAVDAPREMIAALDLSPVERRVLKDAGLL